MFAFKNSAMPSEREDSTGDLSKVTQLCRRAGLSLLNSLQDGAATCSVTGGWAANQTSNEK